MKLNLGCGALRLDNHINIDFVATEATDQVFDLEKPLTDMYKPETVSSIVALHLFEHLSIQSVESVLKSWYEVLQEDGTLLMELPDFDACIKWYQETEAYGSLEWIYGNQERKGQNHKWGWNQSRLTHALIGAGFKLERIEFMEPRTYQSSEGPCLRVVARK